MQTQELAILAGITPQWLNKLLARKGVPGVRRKKNGRLEIFDDEKAAEWAAKRKKKKPRPQRKGWVESGRTSNSRKARAELFLQLDLIQIMRRPWEKNIPELAQKFGISKQALYQAVNRADKNDPGVKSFVVRGYDRNSDGSKRRKRFSPGLARISD